MGKHRGGAWAAVTHPSLLLGTGSPGHPVCFSVQVVKKRLRSDKMVCRGLVGLLWGLYLRF